MNWSWMLPESFSTFGGEVDAIYYVILWVTGIVFVITEGLLVYFVVRYRHKEGRKATFDHGSTRVEVAWTLAPLFIVIGLGVASKGVWDRMKRDVPDGALEMIVTAQQFEWHATYAGADGVLGTDDDFTLVNELHAPEDRPVLVYLRSNDVLHSFFLPEMRVKQDAVPGQEIRAWFEAVQPGDYTLGCAELCGTGHTTMNGTLTVHTQADYDTWVAGQVAQQQ
jgi:cytochrome c oxidase subunit 2